MTHWRKPIPESRDRLQSRLLVWIVGLILACACLPCLILMLHPYNSGLSCLWSFEVSLTFGIVVWALRAATLPAAICGSMVCLLLTVGTMHSASFLQATSNSGLLPLMVLFLCTFAATRAGKVRKRIAGLAESPRGRRASQIIANLGAAALVTLGGFFGLYDFAANPHISPLVSASVRITSILLLATLAEATADTVSSELGQAFGGQPYLLTTFRRVPAGTDGAITLLGTLTGILAAALVIATGIWSLQVSLAGAAIALAAATFGLFFDSLLGATLERRGYLGNDLVNFLSTLAAPAAALALLLATS